MYILNPQVIFNVRRWGNVSDKQGLLLCEKHLCENGFAVLTFMWCIARSSGACDRAPIHSRSQRMRKRRRRWRRRRSSTFVKICKAL